MARRRNSEQLVQKYRGTHRGNCLFMFLEIPDPIDGLQRHQGLRLTRAGASMTSLRSRDILNAEAGGPHANRIVGLFGVKKEPLVPSANQTITGSRYDERCPDCPVDRVTISVFSFIANYFAQYHRATLEMTPKQRVTNRSRERRLPA